MLTQFLRTLVPNLKVWAPHLREIVDQLPLPHLAALRIRVVAPPRLLNESPSVNAQVVGKVLRAFAYSGDRKSPCSRRPKAATGSPWSRRASG